MRLMLTPAFLILLIFSACDRGHTGSGPVPSSPALGHFRLKLFLNHTITDKSEIGRLKILKAYPPVLIAQADFYISEGSAPESIATLPDGHLLLLKLNDLKLSPAQFEVRERIIDANFNVESAVATLSAKSYRYASTTPQAFARGFPVTGEFTFLEKMAGNAALGASFDSELTYLGLENLPDLMKTLPLPVTINHLPSDFLRNVESDLAKFADTLGPPTSPAIRR